MGSSVITFFIIAVAPVQKIDGSGPGVETGRASRRLSKAPREEAMVVWVGKVALEMANV